MDRPIFFDPVRTNELEDQLHRRDVELTESRLQSLASFQQIEQLQETVSSLEVCNSCGSMLLQIVTSSCDCLFIINEINLVTFQRKLFH